MDRLAHISIINCSKELESLRKLILSGRFDHEKIADWIEEIHWNLSNVLLGQCYNSDEFQHLLKKFKALSDVTDKNVEVEVHSMNFKNDYGDSCSSCGIWVQNTGDWYCEDCGEPTCESCGLVEEDEEEFICRSCFSKDQD